MKIHIIQHVAFEGPGHIATWAAARNHSVSATALYESDNLPEQDQFDMLVIMGGPMNIYQEDAYPWLKREKAFIRQAIAAGKRVIGICLGAQLLADILGSPVYSGKNKEIGWMPIQLTPEAHDTGFFPDSPSSFTVFHWHGDTFNIPQGALHLASSEGCHSQAFLFEKRVLGLQFHLESTPDSVDEIVRNCRHELIAGPYIQSEQEILQNVTTHCTSNTLLLDHLLDAIMN